MSRRENKIIELHQQIEQERKIIAGLRAELAQEKARADAAEKRAAAIAKDIEVINAEYTAWVDRESEPYPDKVMAFFPIELATDAGLGFVPRAELERAQAERDKTQSVIDAMRASDADYAAAQDPADWVGYFVPYSEVERSCQRAWPTPKSYGESPLELIARIIDDRDEWKAKAEAVKIDATNMRKLAEHYDSMCRNHVGRTVVEREEDGSPAWGGRSAWLWLVDVADEVLGLRRRLGEAVETLKDIDILLGCVADPCKDCDPSVGYSCEFCRVKHKLLPDLIKKLLPAPAPAARRELDHDMISKALGSTYTKLQSRPQFGQLATPAAKPEPAPAPATGAARYWWNDDSIYKDMNGVLFSFGNGKWTCIGNTSRIAPDSFCDPLDADTDEKAIRAAEKMRKEGGR